MMNTETSFVSVGDIAVTDMWRNLFVISATINTLFMVQLLLRGCIHFIWTRKMGQLPKYTKEEAKSLPTDFIHRERAYISSLMVDSVLSCTICGASLYILVTGAVVNPFIIPSSSPNITSTVTLLSAITIGRLCVAVFMGARRMRVIQGASAMYAQVRQSMEGILVIISLMMLLSSREALLTRVLLITMSMDHNAYSIGHLFSGQESPHSVTRKLLVVQCLLSLTFRGIVPLVCLVVSLSVYDNDVLAMTTMSVAIVICWTIIHVFYSTWVIVCAFRQVCLVYFLADDTKKSIIKAKTPLECYFPQNNLRPSPLVTQIYTRTDLCANKDHGFMRPLRGMRTYYKNNLLRVGCNSKPKPMTVLKTTNGVNKIVSSKPCSNINCRNGRNLNNMTAMKSNLSIHNVPEPSPALSIIPEEPDSLSSVSV